ncbi:MAG: hypothetical protein WDA16_04220 [Candidatus Thermoplasmatota archaeon]
MQQKPAETKMPRTKDRRAYQASRRAQAVMLYFRSVDELAAYRAAAEEGGYAKFNTWILQMLANAGSGSLFPPEYVDGLKRELEKTRSWLETSRDENADYRAQLKLLQAQRDTLLTLLHGLPDGAEVAARFLEQVTSKAAVA